MEDGTFILKPIILGIINKWHGISGDEFSRWEILVQPLLDYLKRTPQVGISGKGTLDRMKPEGKEYVLKRRNGDSAGVNDGGDEQWKAG